MAIRFAPRIRDDASTIAADSQAIFKTVTIIGGDDIFMPSLGPRARNRAALDQRRDEQGENNSAKTGSFHSASSDRRKNKG